MLYSLALGLCAAVYVHFKMAADSKETSSPKPAPKDAPVTSAQRAAVRADDQKKAATKLKATFDRISANHESFGKVHQNLLFPNSLPLREAPPADLPEGHLCETQESSLRRHRWPDGRFSFTLDGCLLPIAVYKRERVTIRNTRETESLQGYSWCEQVPALEELLKDSFPNFELESDGKVVAKLFKSETVHSTDLTTYLYLILDKTKPSLEIQYYHDFDGE